MTMHDCKCCFNCAYWKSIPIWYVRFNILIRQPKFGTCNANNVRKSTVRFNGRLQTHRNHYCTMHKLKQDDKTN